MAVKYSCGKCGSSFEPDLAFGRTQLCENCWNELHKSGKIKKVEQAFRNLSYEDRRKISGNETGEAVRGVIAERYPVGESTMCDDCGCYLSEGSGDTTRASLCSSCARGRRSEYERRKKEEEEEKEKARERFDRASRNL